MNYKQEEMLMFLNELLTEKMWVTNINVLNRNLELLSRENKSLFPSHLSYENRNYHMIKAIKYWLDKGVLLSDEMSYKVLMNRGEEVFKSLLGYMNINAVGSNGVSICARAIYKGIGTKLVMSHPNFDYDIQSYHNKDRILAGLFNNTHHKTVNTFLIKYPHCLNGFDKDNNYKKMSSCLEKYFFKDNKNEKTKEILNENKKMLVEQIIRDNLNLSIFVKDINVINKINEIGCLTEKGIMEEDVQLSNKKAKVYKF